MKRVFGDKGYKRERQICFWGKRKRRFLKKRKEAPL